MSGADVVIVGAGAAGLAAAGLLRRAGRCVIVIEAAPTIGGRARTVRPPALGGASIDEGATWLHQVDRNPLVMLARAAGDPLHAAHQGGRLLMVGDRPASDDEEQAYGAADEAWRSHVRRRLTDADCTLAEAGSGFDDPWQGNLEAWEGAIIAAADADVLSLRDWDRNQLDDGDLRPAHGIGTLLAERLGPLAGPIRLGVAATAIDWGMADGVAVTTTAGTIRARACIVTVSTGVLRDGRIGFSPGLPAETLAALDGLPMGLLSKLALPAAGEDRLGLAPGTLIERRMEARGSPLMLLGAWPEQAPYVTGFFGGRFAWGFTGREDDAIEAVRDDLGSLLGHAATHAVGTRGFVSRWGSDPLFLGAYAYARPGCVESREALGRPLADGRLIFAGEACCADGLAGTVGGAMRDGERAAHVVLRGLGHGRHDPLPWLTGDVSDD